MEFGQIVLFCCFVPSLILAIASFFIVKNFVRFLQSVIDFTAPDTEELHQQYEALKAQHPQDSREQLIDKIVNKYAIQQGIVGAVTSIGGFIVLPFGLTIDLVYSAKSNSSLSYFIAQTYGIQDEAKSLNLGQLLVLSQRKIPVDELVMWQEQLGGVAFRQFLQTVMQKTVAKLIPGFGAFIGFAVNYFSVQFFGRLAKEYYSGNLEKLIGKGAVALGNLTPETRGALWDGFKTNATALLGSNISTISSMIPKLQAQNYNPTEDRVSQLQKIVEMKENGTLTEEEFNMMKQAILGGLAEQMNTVEEEVLDNEPQLPVDSTSDAEAKTDTAQQ